MDYLALVKLIAQSLVTNRDAVDVTAERDSRGILRMVIHVADEDTGRVIGRRGATINAIRQLLRVAAVKSGETIEVDVAEAADGEDAQ